MAIKNILLTGYMGTGKTTVGAALAASLGWQFVDTDKEIEKLESMSISNIFYKYGEKHFRSLENEICSGLPSKNNTVIATGGGMPLNPRNRHLMSSSGIVVNLRCDLQEALKRVGDTGTRPILEQAKSPLEIAETFRTREPVYASFPFQIDTTDLTPEETVNHIKRLLVLADGGIEFRAVKVSASQGYTICIGNDALNLIGHAVSGRGISRRICIVTDSNVEPLYLYRIESSLIEAGFKPFSCVIPAGESSKTSLHLNSLYSRFLSEGLDRRGAVIALGGGVVGDLAGFAAATYMRGVRFFQCPTTLLAMIDSSVGGKTGIDLPEGKNLVGAFKQPDVVVADTATLITLPKQEILNGMAELIKHAIIGDKELFLLLERASDKLVLDPSLIARSVSVKIQIVESDPEETGPREVLNLGHTVGHALEKCSNFKINHGEAVAVGMLAAAKISAMTGTCGPEIPDRIESILVKTGLPIFHDSDPSAVLTAMLTDKKSVEGHLRFVLIKNIGDVIRGMEVSPKIIKKVVTDLRKT